MDSHPTSHASKEAADRLERHLADNTDETIRADVDSVAFEGKQPCELDDCGATPTLMFEYDEGKHRSYCREHVIEMYRCQRDRQTSSLKRQVVGLDRLATELTAAWPYRAPHYARNFTPESYAATDERAANAWKQVEAWCDDGWITAKKNLVIWGDRGAGKTALAHCAVLALIDRYPEALQARRHWETDELMQNIEWLNVATWLAKTKAGFNGAPKPTVNLDAALMILDDLGTERPTDWSLSEIANVIYERHESGRPTIVTTNFRPAKLAVRLAGRGETVEGERLVSRLCGNGATIVHLGGADRRLAHLDEE